jgi:hypothetical protein
MLEPLLSPVESHRWVYPVLDMTLPPAATWSVPLLNRGAGPLDLRRAGRWEQTTMQNHGGVPKSTGAARIEARPTDPVGGLSHYLYNLIGS